VQAISNRILDIDASVKSEISFNLLLPGTAIRNLVPASHEVLAFGQGDNGSGLRNWLGME
jgi:hypothetical protein